MTPSLQEILAAYKRVNAWERDEARQQPPTLKVEEGICQYSERWELARRLSLDADAIFLQGRVADYEYLHSQMSERHRLWAVLTKTEARRAFAAPV